MISNPTSTFVSVALSIALVTIILISFPFQSWFILIIQP